MERQAGLGRSLEDVLDALTPVEPADAPGHALFGLGTDDAPVPEQAKPPKKKSGKQQDDKKKSKSKSKNKNKSKKNKKKKNKKKKSGE